MNQQVDVKRTPRLVATVSETCEMLRVQERLLRRLERDDPTFPRRIQISHRKTAFRISELEAWIASRPEHVSE